MRNKNVNASIEYLQHFVLFMFANATLEK